jgi:lipoate-protein ligase A
VEALSGCRQLNAAYAGLVATSRSAWIIEHSHGDAGTFHARDPIAVRSATFHTVDRRTLALGSAQSSADVDRGVANALDVDVVQRRSGGGAVLLWPGEFVWLDLVIPVGDPLWAVDVGKAMWWVGALWRDALADLGVVASVHHGGLMSTAWSRQVCWAGGGTGEVMAGDGRTGSGKVVGISQRRTREVARFQSMCHLRWRPEVAAALVSPPRPTAVELAGVAAWVDLPPASIRAALTAHLP